MTWDWKIEEYGKSSGIIADELESIDELKFMLEGKKGDYSIQYNCLHGFYIEAIKDLKQKVQDLEAETRQLRQKVISLERSHTPKSSRQYSSNHDCVVTQSQCVETSTSCTTN